MDVRGLTFEADGVEHVTYTTPVGKREVVIEALADPMSLGPDGLETFLTDLSNFRQMLSAATQQRLMFLFPSKDDTLGMFRGWSEATGIGMEGLGILIKVFEHLDKVESDFQRYYHLDLVDWFRRKISSRKIAVLAIDLSRRPETSFGAELSDIDPMSKLEVMFAQYYGGMTENKKPHAFLTARQDRIEQAEMEERKQRMLARGLSA